MNEVLSEQFSDSLSAQPVFASTEFVPPPGPDGAGPSRLDADSFLDMLGHLERHQGTGDRSHVIASYQAWIARNSTASTALYAGWFNLGVELAGAGDKAGAIAAYQHALALRPNFYPAALNLGTLMESAGQPEAALAIWQQALQPEEARTALLEYREHLAEAYRVERLDAASVLHVGSGAYDREKLPAVFRHAGDGNGQWQARCNRNTHPSQSPMPLSHKETLVLSRTNLTTKYIEILKKSLNNELYVDNELRYRLAIGAVIENRVPTIDGLYDLTQHQDLLNNLLECKQRGNTFLPVYKETGLAAHFMRNFLEVSHTMIGHKRLDNIQYCIETVLEDNIEGDIIETGIWRGGAIILMCGILAAYGVTDRIVWAADSFAGVPIPTLSQDDNFDISERVFPFLTVSLDQVKALIEKYGLLDKRVRFLEGWFKDTLPVAPIQRLAVLRLDGDLYESTMDALNPLYAKVSPGGFIIVDDYFSCPPCRLAIDTFRNTHGITDTCIQIDDQSVFWRKST